VTAWEEGLLKICSTLSVQDRGTLLSFAGFLVQQGRGVDMELPSALPVVQEKPVLAKPENIARPDDESTVAALKRLSAIYPMLDKNILLDQTSSLMISHIMQGKDKKGVIDELEQIFKDEYARLEEQMESE